jgi:hypothetical protein
MLVGLSSLVYTGCGGSDVEPARPPKDARSEGPALDPATLEDPMVKAFAVEAALFLELSSEIEPLETRLADGSISESDTEKWRDLEARRAAERTRLNAIMYRPDASAEQRAAMWWVLHGRSAEDDAGTETTDQP